MKNILILINVRWWNATAFYAINTARVLHKKGYAVYVGSKKGSPPYQKALQYNLNVVNLNFERFNPVKLFVNFFRMIRFIKSRQISILNAHRSEDHTFAALARLFAPVKFILTRGDRRRIRKNYLGTLKYRIADGIILTCRSIYEQNKDLLTRFKDKIHIIHGSVDEDHFIPQDKKLTARKYRIDLTKKIVGMAGRLDYVKDQYTFVRAASNVIHKDKNIFFLLTGKEEHIKIKELEVLAKKEGIKDNLIILGHIKDIASVINLFDIAVVTSVDSETISRVVLEYLYLGKPVVGTRVNVIPEIIEHDENGFIIKPRDVQALSDNLIKLLKNRSLLKKMSKRSWMRYQNFFSEDKFFQQLKNIFE
ncbi:MAG: glycosyltransferase [Spirochaetes bacterium]|nr:glycosyltransferase [Spirochaetota bacterium]